jgi:hypothetical protein
MRLSEFHLHPRFRKLYDSVNEIYGSLVDILIKIENSGQSLLNFILFFFFSCSLRTYFERFSDNDFARGLILLSPYLNYPLILLNQALFVITIIWLVLRRDVLKITKLILASFIFTVSVPIIDFMINPNKGFDITVIYPDSHPNIFQRFLSFMRPDSTLTATPGQRIEIAVALFISFIYFQRKNSNIIRNLLGCLLLYILIFSYIALPYFITAFMSLFKISYLSFSYSTKQYYILQLNYLLLPILSLVIFKLIKKEAGIVFKKLNYYRLMEYLISFTVGSIFGLFFGNKFVNIKLVIDYYLIGSSVFAFWFATEVYYEKMYIKNCIMLQSRIDEKQLHQFLKNLYLGLIGFSIFITFGVNFVSTVVIFTLVGNYYLFYSKIFPWESINYRLFRILFCSVNSLLLFSLGFYYFKRSLINFPSYVFLILIIIHFVFGNLIRKDNIQLKPNLNLGLEMRSLIKKLAIKLYQHN